MNNSSCLAYIDQFNYSCGCNSRHEKDAVSIEPHWSAEHPSWWLQQKHKSTRLVRFYCVSINKYFGNRVIKMDFFLIFICSPQSKPNYWPFMPLKIASNDGILCRSQWASSSPFFSLTWSILCIYSEPLFTQLTLRNF